MAWVERPKSGSLEGLVGRGFTGDVDEFPLVGGVDSPGFDRDDAGFPLGQALRHVDGPALVPEQQDERAKEQEEADRDADQRLADPREPAFRTALGEGIAPRRAAVAPGRPFTPRPNRLQT